MENKHFVFDLEQYVVQNKNYREVLHTTRNQQLVAMSLKRGENIGMEIHPKTTQFFKIEKGKGMVILDKKTYHFEAGDSIVVDPGVEHDVIAKTNVKLYTIYSPPEHPKDTIQKDKE